MKFPSRWQYGQYMFYDCQPDGAQPGAPNVNMGGYTIETLAGEAKGSSQSPRWFNENPIGSGNPFWGPCDFSTQTYPFKKTSVRRDRHIHATGYGDFALHQEHRHQGVRDRCQWLPSRRC